MSFVKISLLPDYDSIFHAWLALQMGWSHDPLIISVRETCYQK